MDAYLCFYDVAEIPPLIDLEVVEVCWSGAPIVCRNGLERGSEYVPCAWDVEK